MIKQSDTKEKILRAAREIFVEKGKDGARMQEIADRAGVNKALLHYYYTSKDVLYQEIIFSAFNELFQNLNELFDESISFEEQLRQFIERHIDFVSRNRDLVRLLVQQMLREDLSLLKPLAKLVREQFRLPVRIRRIFEENMKAGLIRVHNPAQTMISILSMNLFYFVISPFVQEIVPEFVFDEKQFIEERKQAIFELVLNGIKPPESKT